MNQQQLIAAARSAAETHKLVPELVCALVEQESGWDQWLNRYEPAFENNSEYSVKIHEQAREFAATSLTKYLYETDYETEVKNRCMSWGLMQVLGQTAREMGFKEPIPSMGNVAVGLEIGCAKLARCVALHNGNLTAALEAYNGGSRPDYASQVFARVQRYKEKNT